VLDTNIKPCRVFTNSGTTLLESDTYSSMVVHTNKQEEKEALSVGLAVAMMEDMKVMAGVTTG
jgi:hypothetical protein